MKLCERLVSLEQNFTNTFSNEKMTHISNVDLDRSIKLDIHDFSCWDHLRFRKLILSCENLKIQNLNRSNTTNVHPDELKWFKIFMSSLYTHIMSPCQFLEFLEHFMILLIFFGQSHQNSRGLMFSKTIFYRL
jgi:hypothetical protein